MRIESETKWVYIWLVAGTVLMYFSNWNWAVPAATWLFAIFLLRFARSRKMRTGQPALFLACSIVGIASMWRLLAIDALPPAFRIVSGLVFAVLLFLPFLADRLLVGKLPGLVGTLIFPCSWTALEYLKSLGNGSWGALAYSQYGNLPFMQLASLTGIWGLTFIITWFAAIVNFAWEQQFVWAKIRTISILYGVIIVTVFVYGYGRLATTETVAEKVSIASITNPEDFFDRFYGPDWSDRKSASTRMEKDLDFLFAETKTAAKAGAKIVFWQEYAVCVMAEDEPEFIARAQKIAREEQIYLVLPMGFFPATYPEQLWQNKLIWIDPGGKVIDQYWKLKPAPPLEPITPGSGGIHVVNTSHGKIAAVICADLDYPGMIRQAGADHAGILLIPAQDWEAVDPLHSYMAAVRAIENGFSVVKGTGGGLSVAVDPYGRIINSSASANPSKNQMISCLPRKGIVTIYARIGDSFAWLCIAGFLVLIVCSRFSPARAG